MSKITEPSNLKEFFSYFEDEFSDKELNDLRELSEDDLALTHFSLGLFIRNKWIRPEESSLRKALSGIGSYMEPDATSSLLIKALWLHLNGEEIDVPKFRELLKEVPAILGIPAEGKELDQAILNFLGTQ